MTASALKPIEPKSLLRASAAAVVLAALAACAGTPSPAEMQPASADVPQAAPAEAAPVTMSNIDPLNAPPPPATAANGMLVPAPDAGNASQRVPLGSLNAPPAAPTSILTPPGQTPAPAMASAAPAPQTMTPAAAPPMAAPVMTPPKPAPAMQPAPQVAAAAPAPPPAAKPPAQVQLHMPSSLERLPTATPLDSETVVISSATTTQQAPPREFVPASLTPVVQPPPPSPGEIRLTAAEKNSEQRFEILKRLEDEGLITHEEYVKRRTANAGALLPYTHQPPAVGLERTVPSGDAIVARLAALRRSFEMRAITPEQHALERTMILNALLPEAPSDRTEAKPPPEDMIEGAADAGHLESLRQRNLITDAEMDAEKAAIEHAVATGLLPSQDPAVAARKAAAAKAAANAAAAANMAAAKAKPAEPSAMETEITGPVVHLASYRTEAAAMQGWQELLTHNKPILGPMKPIVRKVDLGDKGIFYRLMAGSYPSMSEAEAACVKLKESGQFCRTSADGS